MGILESDKSQFRQYRRELKTVLDSRPSGNDVPFVC